MAGEGLDLSALRTKQGVQVSLGSGISYSVGVPPKEGHEPRFVYINGIKSSSYAEAKMKEQKRKVPGTMHVEVHDLPDNRRRVVVGGVDHLVVQDNGDVQLGGDRGVRVCIDGTVKLGGGEDDREGRVWIDAENKIIVGGQAGLTISPGRWSLRRAVRRAFKPFVTGMVVGALCYVLYSNKAGGSGKAPAGTAPAGTAPPALSASASTSSRLQWSRF